VWRLSATYEAHGQESFDTYCRVHSSDQCWLVADDVWAEFMCTGSGEARGAVRVVCLREVEVSELL